MAEADEQWRKGDVPATKRLLAKTPPKQRGWEWDMLTWRCDAQKQSFPRGSAGVFLAWRPDGKALAVSSYIGDVHILDLRTNKLVRSIFPARGCTGGAIWLDGGKQLAMACGDGKVRILDAASGKKLRVFAGSPPNIPNTDPIISEIAVSPDQRLILTVGGNLNDKGWVRLCDLASGTLIKTFIGHRPVINAVAFNRDGKSFATAGHDGVIHIWNIARDQPISSARGHGQGNAFVYDVIFTPDGKHLATSGQDGLVHLWDAATLKRVRTFKSTGSDVRTVAVSPDGKALAGIAVDGTATLWDISTGKIVTLFRGHGHLPLSVGFSPDGKLLATSGQKSTRIWDINTRQDSVLFGRATAKPAFTCDGAKIVALGQRAEGLRTWSPDGRTMLADLKELGDSVAQVACHPANPNLLLTMRTKGRLDLWNLPDKRSEWTIPAPANKNTFRAAPAFSPDGRLMAVGSFVADIMGPRLDAVLSLYDAKSGKWIMSMSFPYGDRITATAFSPDGKYVAACSPYLYPSRKQTPGGVAIWRVSDGKHIRTLPGRDGGLYSFAFSPDGKQIALGNNNGVIRLLDIESGQSTAALDGHKYRVRSLAFSPDGRRLVSGGRTALLWDILTAQPVMTLVSDDGGYDKRFSSVAFSPDGKSVMAGGYNRKMRLWSVPPGQ